LQAPPNGFTTGGQTIRPRACALPHACEVRPFSDSLRTQSKWLGRRPLADQTQVAAATQTRISPTQLQPHACALPHACSSSAAGAYGLMVSVDARHTGEPGFESHLRHFFKNCTQHLALPESPAGQTVWHPPLYDHKPVVKSIEKWCTIRYSGQSVAWSICTVVHPCWTNSLAWAIRKWVQQP